MSQAFKYTPRFVDIRIKPPGARRAADRPRECDWAECVAPASCRAPKASDNLREYYMFCPAHAAEYNRNWDFFAGMTAEEVAAFQRDAAHGHRPTWSTGAKNGATSEENLRDASARAKFRWADAFADPFGLFRDAKSSEPGRRKRKLGRLETQALTTLGLGEDAKPEDVRERYAALVKQLHPDANGGDRSTEEQLRKVIRAYKVLKKNRAA